jgi:integrase
MPRRAKPWFRASENTWYATHNGRQRSLGVAGINNEAAAWLAFAQLRAGTRPAELTTKPAAVKPGGTVTTSQLVKSFLDDAAGRVKPDTLEVYRLFLNNFAAKHGDTPAAELPPTTAEAYSRKPTWNDSTRAAFLAVLARAFRFAERARLIERSPLAGLQRPTIGSRAADVLVTAEQCAKLCEVSPPAFARFLRFLYLTGCRPGEAAQLAAADVDWSRSLATLRNHKTKRKGKRRVVYLVPDALALLKELAARHPTGPLLRNRIGNAWTRATLGAAMRTAREAAGLPSAILYGLRHSYITDALAAGVSDALVAALAGHSSTATIHRHYNHVGERVKVLCDAAKSVR